MKCVEVRHFTGVAQAAGEPAVALSLLTSKGNNFGPPFTAGADIQVVSFIFLFVISSAKIACENTTRCVRVWN
jgi:hypothetical protein